MGRWWRVIVCKCRLAGGRPFERGTTYTAQGRVKRLKVGPDEMTAVDRVTVIRMRAADSRVIRRGVSREARGLKLRVERETVAAILAGSAAILAAHSHPSGDPEPSAEDISLTRRLAAAGQLLGIELLDHVILGEAGRFVSLRERGVL